MGYESLLYERGALSNSGCKKLDDQARSGGSKIVHSAAVLRAIKANPMISLQDLLLFY